MNTPSPLVPQGATPPRAKNSLYIKILMILSVHVVVIGGMLLQGCTHTTDQAKQEGSSTTAADTAAVPATPPNTTPAPGSLETAPVYNPSLTATTSVTSVTPGPTPFPMPSNTSLALKPTQTDVTAPIAPGEGKDYVIVKGDTLAVIARKNGVSLKALQEANPGVDPKKLQIDHKLHVPAASAALATTTTTNAVAGAADATQNEYVVKAGDVLIKIAKSHGTTVKKIMAMNELKSTSIRAGQKLKLPAKEPAAAASATTAAPITTASAAPLPAPTPAGGRTSPVAAN
jgi:LysM repeat protein